MSACSDCDTRGSPFCIRHDCTPLCYESLDLHSVQRWHCIAMIGTWLVWFSAFIQFHEEDTSSMRRAMPETADRNFIR